MRKILTSLLALLILAAGCGSSSEEVSNDDDTAATTAPVDEGSDTTEAPATTERPAEGPATLAVPDDFATIQAAVDAAMPGDLVLIGPGTYNENVVVDTDDLVIRGLDRNEVILDGGFELENGFIVFSNGVAIENLTIHSYTSNGIFFTGDYGEDLVLTGYRASYITTYNNGLYGLYAFNASDGLFEESYGSGHPDSGFYIGQCQPCNAVIRNVLSENNALGYSGTNAGGELYIINSEFRNNRIGVVPNTLDSEELAPQDNITIVGNFVHDNGNESTPLRGDDWDLAFGGGIVLAGGINNSVLRNRVENNPFVGIVAALFVDDNIWPAMNNRVAENVVSGSEADLAVLVGDPTAGAQGNCFEGNTFATSIPAAIETQAACGAPAAPLDGNGAPNPGFGTFTSVDYKTMAAPGPQPNMANAATAAPQPATGMPAIDIETISVP